MSLFNRIYILVRLIISVLIDPFKEPWIDRDHEKEDTTKKGDRDELSN